MEESRQSSRGLLASIENVNVENLRSKRTVDEMCCYAWHNPQLHLDQRRRVTEQRRDELLHCLYEEGLPTVEAEEMVREWMALLTERDRLLRAHLQQENISRDDSSYVRDLKTMLRAHPPFVGSEEVQLREALHTLEAQVTSYCVRHNIASPITGSKTVSVEMSTSPSELRTPVQSTSRPSELRTPVLQQQPVNLDHQTGQSRITASAEAMLTPHKPLVTPTMPHPSEEVTTPPHPQLPTKPSDLLTKYSPRKENKPRPTGVVLTDNCALDSCEKIITKPEQDNSMETNESENIDGTIPPPPSLPAVTMGTFQFIEPEQISPVKGKSLLVTEAQDPSLEVPTSEERSLLLNEISSVGQTTLRRTNCRRSPGGTPIRVTKNRLTLTGNTDTLQRALISKFRSFHSTPIKRTGMSGGDKSDSMEVSNAWSDVQSSMVYGDPDISAASHSDLCDTSPCVHNLSSAV